MRDATHIKVQLHKPPPGGHLAQAMGRTKGRLNARPESATEVQPQPETLVLTSGKKADEVYASPMIERSAGFHAHGPCLFRRCPLCAHRRQKDKVLHLRRAKATTIRLSMTRNSTGRGIMWRTSLRSSNAAAESPPAKTRPPRPLWPSSSWPFASSAQDDNFRTHTRKPAAEAVRKFGLRFLSAPVMSGQVSRSNRDNAQLPQTLQHLWRLLVEVCDVRCTLVSTVVGADFGARLYCCFFRRSWWRSE